MLDSIQNIKSLYVAKHMLTHWSALSDTRSAPIDSAHVDEAWQLVDIVMTHSAQHVADTRTGSLWQPVQKLYKRALNARNSHQNGQPLEVQVNGAPQHEPSTAVSTGLEHGATSQGAAVDLSAPWLPLETGPAIGNGYSAAHESDQWLDWDAIVADMESVCNNGMIWT